MTDQDGRSRRQFSDEELQDLVASTDSGARNPRSRAVALLIAGLALAWSLFQLWIAQPQLWFSQYLPVLNSTETRPVHLFFAIVLAFLAYPAMKSSPRDRVPLTDWALMAIGGFCAFYVFWFSDTLAMTARSGLPSQAQVVVGAVGLLVLLEAARRALGPALTIVGSLFLLPMPTNWDEACSISAGLDRNTKAQYSTASSTRNVRYRRGLRASCRGSPMAFVFLLRLPVRHRCSTRPARG